MHPKLIAPFSLLIMLGSHPAQAVDWSKVEGKSITLFYPAQMSWELVLTQSEHGGASKFQDGKGCRGCHEGEEAESGNLLRNDKSIEATPIPGKPGSIPVTVKTAHDAERIYIHLEFAPGKQPDAGMDKDFATKVAVMIDDGGVPEAKLAGCWVACHDNAARMPSAGDKDITKYLTRSRVAMNRKGGEDIKSGADLAKIRAEGGFLEYWQARLKSGALEVVDGTILEKRQEHKTPMVAAEALETGGAWAVTFSRKLKAGAGYKDIIAGTTYTVGFSVHAGHTAKRFHYVSFEKTLALDSGAADFVAKSP